MEHTARLKRYLSVFERDIDFHFCRPEEVGLVEQFIEDHWKKGHALARCRELMDWQHYDAQRDRYNFVLALDRKSGELLALQGFITTAQFDPEIQSPALCGAIWKSICEDRYPGVGIVLREIMIHQAPHAFIFGLGMSQITQRTARADKFQIGLLHQNYILHPDRTEFCLAAPSPVAPAPIEGDGLSRFRSLTEETYLAQGASLRGKIPPFKSVRYYVGRYFRHPVYSYHATGVYGKDGDLGAVFFWRKCFAQDSCSLRIVDYIGDGSELHGCKGQFDALLRQEDAEYIDFYQTGLPQQELLSAGFLDRGKTGAVIANYYEPFVLQNVEINYAWSGQTPPLLFKGDADMDRPNLIEVKK